MRILQKVEQLLQKRQDYRDSDRHLLLGVWASEGLHLDEAQKAIFMACSSAETITRARRALKAKYPASQVVEKERFLNYRKVRYGERFWD